MYMMNPVHIELNSKTAVPQRYVPKHLTQKDKTKQKRQLLKSRKLYKRGVYHSRPAVNSFVSRKSSHLNKLKTMYNVNNAFPTPELAKKTKCKLDALKQIIHKGEGAYFSSGSRPNQSAQSWGIARLASSLTGGNASVIDYHILAEGCKPQSKALKLAKKQCKKLNRNCTTRKNRK